MNVTSQSIVFCDGTCGLCQGTVAFVLRHDRRGVLKFAAQQSRVAFGFGVTGVESSVLVWSGGQLLRGFRAVRAILLQMGGIWKVLGLLAGLVPAPIGDAVYGFIANRRHRWFGRRDLCMRPENFTSDRFLDSGEPSSTSSATE